MTKLLKAFVYISKSESLFGQLEMDALLELAKSSNAKYQITGFIVYHKNHFLQYIEGLSPMVDRLMKNIEEDKRHRLIKTIPIPIESKKFPDWSMQWNRYDIGMELVLLDYMSALKIQKGITQVQVDNVHRMINGVANHHLITNSLKERS